MVKWFYVAKVGKSGEKWQKVGKIGEKLGKVANSGESGQKLEKVVKSGKKWGKVGKSWNKLGKFAKSGEKRPFWFPICSKIDKSSSTLGHQWLCQLLI